MQIDYPYHIDGRGRTAETFESDHVRDMIEQLLFTTPGERVNRPDFGSGLLQLVFAPASSELASTTRFLVQAGLQQWLGDRIRVDGVEVDVDDAKLSVTIVYTLLRTDRREVATFTRAV